MGGHLQLLNEKGDPSLLDAEGSRYGTPGSICALTGLERAQVGNEGGKVNGHTCSPPYQQTHHVTKQRRKRTLIIVLNLIKIGAGLGHGSLMKIPKSFNAFPRVTWELWMLHLD